MKKVSFLIMNLKIVVLKSFFCNHMWFLCDTGEGEVDTTDFAKTGHDRYVERKMGTFAA